MVEERGAVSYDVLGARWLRRVVLNGPIEQDGYITRPSRSKITKANIQSHGCSNDEDLETHERTFGIWLGAFLDQQLAVLVELLQGLDDESIYVAHLIKIR